MDAAVTDFQQAMKSQILATATRTTIWVRWIWRVAELPAAVKRAAPSRERIDPGNSLFHSRLGMALSQTGDQDGAVPQKTASR